MITYIITVSTIILVGTVIYLIRELNNLKQRHLQQQTDFKNKEQFIKRDAKKRSGAVQWGLTIENFVPFTSEFPIPVESVTFLGKPIDYIGYTDTDDPENCAVHFVEVKSGRSQLLKHQRNIKNAIKKGRVHWHEIRIGSNSVN